MINKIVLIFKKGFMKLKGKSAKGCISIRGIDSNKIFTISNVLTILRILTIPFIAYGIIKQKWVFVFVLFGLSASTDVLDGYLARIFKERTALGAMLDPLADKIFLLAVFTALVFSPAGLVLPLWFLIFLILRELTIVVGAFIIFCCGKKLRIQPTRWGKLTTLFQSFFIFWYIVCSFFGWLPQKTYFLVLVLLTCFSLFSLVDYIKIGYKQLKNKTCK
jgi:cardiolipin synthase (CMP-forming)